MFNTLLYYRKHTLEFVYLNYIFTCFLANVYSEYIHNMYFTVVAILKEIILDSFLRRVNFHFEFEGVTYAVIIFVALFFIKISMMNLVFTKQFKAIMIATLVKLFIKFIILISNVGKNAFLHFLKELA